MDYNKITKDELIYDINTALKLIEWYEKYISYKKNNPNDLDKEVELKQIMSAAKSLRSIYDGILN